ncbi:MAG: PAS domain S-box protein [Sedimentisphaerales bacterium]|nr:PAS domain S-box protein [Sedimentisphaerales bacterium]
MLTSVKVPKMFAPLFEAAEKHVKKYFSGIKRDPTKGSIEINGDRYILIRAASMSIDLFEIVRNMYAETCPDEAIQVAQNLLFDIAHTMGRQDAKNFHIKMNLTDTLEKMAAGPLYFSHCGWAFVDIFEESMPSPDENFFMIYDHPYSFEASSWLANGKKSNLPICVMNAGYSSGWCQESFGIPLVTKEILCKARGDEVCRFIMAPPAWIEKHLNKYQNRKPQSATNAAKKVAPQYFNRKLFEQAINYEKKQAQQYLDIAEVMFVTLDRDGIVTSANRKTSEILNCAKQNIIGRDWFSDFMPLSCRKSTKSVFRNMVEGVSTDNIYHENPVLTSDGRERLIAWHNTVLKNPKDEVIGTLSSGEDITERKELQGQLLQAEKMRSIGQLASGIAHEINTPTQYISDNIHFLQDGFTDILKIIGKYQEIAAQAEQGQIDTGQLSQLKTMIGELDLEYLMEEVPQAIKQSLEGVKNVSQIVLAMKGFAHPGVQTKTTHDINRAIESIIIVTKNQWKYVADMKMDFDPELPLVTGFPGELNQVILNLIINASDAITDKAGGNVTEKGTITISTRQAGEWVEIRISDSGTGIPEEIRSQVLNPFFTTKEIGKGSGQGLAIAHSVIVDKHGGTFTFETETGKGTTFIIRIPIESEEATEEQELNEQSYSVC